MGMPRYLPLEGAETVASLHYVQLSGARPHIFIESPVKKLIGNKIHTRQNAQYMCIKTWIKKKKSLS